VGTYKPSGATLEAIAAVLGEHWRTATAHPEKQFWSAPVSWLTVPDVRPRAQRARDHHLTSGGKLIRKASGSASVLKPNFVPRS